MFANLAHATFLLDQDGRISDANPAACTLLEYQKEELLSRGLSDLVTATVREDTLKLVRSLEIEVPLTVQCSFGTRKGEDVFVELRLARYFSKARVSIIASCRNVADQQRARADLESALAKLNRSELRLRRSEATLAEAQKLSHTGSVFWRPSTGQIKWSEETYRIYGYSPEIKPTMQLVRQRVHPDDRALFDETALQAPQKGEDLQFESRLLMPNGEVKHIRFVSRAMRNSTGELEFMGR